MNSIKERSWLRRSYIGKHWGGELSLPISYFINGIVATLAVMTFVAAISATLSSHYEPRFGFLAVTATWVIALIVTVWQIVGVWRSADNHPKRGGKRFWAGVAKFMVVIGVLQTISVFTQQGWPQIAETYKIATGDPDIGEFEFRLVNTGTEIELSGGVVFGVTAELTTLLDAAPEVHTIRLNSHGGRILAAENLRDLIRRRNLNTYVSAQCFSACTVAYLGGRKRYLHPAGRLGFHASSFPGVTEMEMRSENQNLANEAVAQGVERGFAEKAYLYPAENMWFPTTQELLDARFATHLAAKEKKEPASQETVVGAMVRSRGLEETLKALSANSGALPRKVDEVTTLSKIEASGTQLRRTFNVDGKKFLITDEFQKLIENILCAYPPFIPLLQEGASIREVYVSTDGTPIGQHIVTWEACGHPVTHRQPNSDDIGSLVAPLIDDPMLKFIAALDEKNDAAAEQAIREGANVDFKILGRPLLVAAVYSNDLKEVVFLIRHGADVNIRTPFGRTPLHEASLYGHHEITEVLINAGADVNARNKRGETPLYYSEVGLIIGPKHTNMHDKVSEILRAHGGLR